MSDTSSMKSRLVSLLTTILTPALLLAHYLTQHDAFVFVLGAASIFSLLVIMVFILIWVLWVIGADFDGRQGLQSAFEDMKAELLKETSGWRAWRGWLVTVTASAYLLYFQAFITAALYLLVVAGGLALRWLVLHSDDIIEGKV